MCFLSPAKRFGGGGEDIVLALAFLSITLFCPDAYLGNGFSDFIILYQEGDIVLALSVHPSSFCPSGRLWTKESWPKAHCEVTCLLPLTKWESCQLLAKLWGKHWLWHPGRSLKDWLPANYGVKPHTDKNKQVSDNRQ